MPRHVDYRVRMSRHRIQVGRMIETLEQNFNLTPVQKRHLIGIARQLQQAFYQVELDPRAELTET
jgi:hypothetical protein